ncbi:MAG: tRNA 5-methoxyuridine(34)/uridine 5-oxyacetic acid(34) synthase CmoB [Victivallaceae bacterium]|nr:tRNA 5-methoxyuridine(34)/uridine 5-oxyacetic acid(34) synthase CmoB [Victivallaceae bacterium]
MISPDYAGFEKTAAQTALAPWAGKLYKQSQAIIDGCSHGHLDMWLKAINALPEINLSSVDIAGDTIRAGIPEDCDETCRKKLYACMQELRPWRKGPFDICGMKIDTEWRSDWKWQRLEKHIAPLQDRLVLDIGCGSGYHTWRMAGAGAKLAVGIEPYKVFVMQYWAMRHFLKKDSVWALPLGLEDMPEQMRVFDTVFSMGVLYHRKSPMDHLLEICGMLRPGGEMVLETLVVEGDENTVLVPEGRYAKMRNVWFLPSTSALEKWLRKLGFENVRTVDVNKTTVEEQRTTDWMRWESLKDYLHPDDPKKSFEGYPAPLRAIILANA